MCACGSGYLCMDVFLAHDFTCQGAPSLLVIYLNKLNEMQLLMFFFTEEQ